MSEGYGGGPVPPGAFRPPVGREALPGGGGLPGQPGGSGSVGLGGASGASREYAEWWRRAVAALVDGAILVAIAAALYGVCGTVGFSLDGGNGFVGLIVSALLASVLLVVAVLLYRPVMMVKTNGQTVGKMLTSIRVVRVDGRRMEFGWAILREVVFKGVVLHVVAIFTGGIAYLIDFLWPLIDGENRALHDFPVDTRVVRA